MKIREVIVNNRKARLELWVRAGDVYPVPYAKLDPRPTSRNRIRDAYVDKELGNEAVTYVLESGAEGTVHIDYALEYNQNPGYLAELLAHRLSVEARNRAKRSGLAAESWHVGYIHRCRSSIDCSIQPTRARASSSSSRAAPPPRLHRRGSAQARKAA